jgi:hypothetical protein
MDLVVVLLCIVAFAGWVTVHVLLALALASRPPRWRALVGLFVVPLAPWWAWRERMRVRVGLWAGMLAVYVVALALALRH